MPIWSIALVTVLLLAVLALGIFNRLVTLRNRLRNAFSQIDVQLKRRHDLIPNLVEAVKGYMQHERSTLEAVTKARSTAVAASQALAARPGDTAALHGVLAAEGVLGATTGRLLGLAERYPELRASQSAGQLMEELITTENRIAFARQAYNDSVAVYNTAREQFPHSLVAGATGFEAAELFELSSDAEAAVPRAQLV